MNKLTDSYRDIRIGDVVMVLPSHRVHPSWHCLIAVVERIALYGSWACIAYDPNFIPVMMEPEFLEKL